MKALLIKILRDKRSYDYKYSEEEAKKLGIVNEYALRTKNNSLDSLILLKGDKELFRCNTVQTVANHPHYDYNDTIAMGKFQVQCFVKPRKFHGQIHGIVYAKDIEGQNIDAWSMQVENGYQKGRWLIHDRWSWDKNRDLNNGYSGGCFIMPSIELEQFNIILNNEGIHSNPNLKQIINGILLEIESFES